MNSTVLLWQKWFVDECFKWLPLNTDNKKEEPIKAKVEDLIKIESPEEIISKIEKWEYELIPVDRSFDENLGYLIFDFNINTPLWTKPLKVIFYSHISRKFLIEVNKSAVEFYFYEKENFLNVINWHFTIPSYIPDWDFWSKIVIQN